MSNTFKIIYKKDDETEISTLLLTQEECINLEVKLNLTEYSRKWVGIGDNLYNFAIQKKKCKTEINVTKFQYDYLKLLHENKSVDTAVDDFVNLVESFARDDFKNKT
tara:strand:+ start:236 stop:556 length:321 start_codon:yes stop_codon:yes gene_type:complete